MQTSSKLATPVTRSLRTHVLAGVAVMFLTWALLQFFAARFVIHNNFLEHERDYSLSKGESVSSLLARELRRLDYLGKDWSLWDDTYEFLRGKNPEFIEKNIYEDVFTNLSLDLIAYIDPDGRPVLLRSINAETGEARSIPPHLLEQFSAGGAWLQAHVKDQATTGFMAIDQQLVAFSAQPVHRSKLSDPGPSVGTQIFVRYLGEDFVGTMREVLRSEVEIFTLDKPFLPDDVRQAARQLSRNAPRFVAPINEQQNGIYVLAVDPSGEPAAVIRVTEPRVIHIHTRKSARALFVITLSLGVLAGLGVFWFIEKRILQRVLTLESEVLRVAAAGEPAQRIAPLAEWEDELARLARAVNEMLAEIEIHQDARDARDAALAASRLKSEFLASISHEVRTPLNGIFGMLQLALENELTPAQRERVAAAYRAAVGLLTIVDDMVEFSTLRAGAVALAEREFDLRDLFESALQPFAARGEQRGVQFLCFIDPAVAEMYRGDSFRLRQVAVNLLDNALKFTLQGSVTLELHRRESTARGDALELSVTDSGMGMSPSQLINVFKPQQQENDASMQPLGGARLGLSICQQVIKQMGGVFDIDSTLGDGTRARATFWLKRAAPARSHDSLDAQIVLVGPRDAQQVNLVKYLRALSCDILWADEVSLSALPVATKPRIAIVDVSGDTDSKQVPAELIALPVLRITRISAPPEPAAMSGITLAGPVRWHALVDALRALRKPLPEARVDALDFSDKRVLLVEDVELNRRVAVQLLASYGIHTDTAASAREAMYALDAHRYDMMLVVWRLNTSDGLDLTRHWRAQELARGAPRLPIVALRTSLHSGDKALYLGAEMDDMLTKPLMRDELTRVLVRWLLHETPKPTGTTVELEG